MTSCFTQCIALKISIPPSIRRNQRYPICTYAPERPNKSVTEETNQFAHRVLPENLSKSERPPLPPAHRSVPIFGFFLEKLLGIDTTPREKRQRYGPVYSSNYFIDQRTYISDYNAVVDALRDEEVFRVKGAIEVFTKMFGEGNILSTDFDMHRKARSAILPAFAPGIFPQYMGFITKRVRKTWERVLERSVAGERIKLDPVFRENYLSIIVEMTTGIDEDATRIGELFQKFLITSFSPQFGPFWNAGMRARDELMAILEDVVRKNLRERAETINKLREYGDRIMKMGVKEISVGNVDVLLVLMAAETSISTIPGEMVDENIVKSLCNVILILWSAGYSSSASTSICMSFEMGFDDVVMKQLVTEQDTIVAAANGNKDVTYEQAMNEMPLLDSYAQEILRTRPPLSVLGRKVAKDIELFGYFVPKDTLVLLDLAGVHLDPNIYPNPEQIIVDRFVKREGKSRPPSILSFGASGSAHYCVGAALAKVMMKTTMGALLREYSYVLDKHQSKEYQSVPEMSPKSGVVLETFNRRT